jgi:uncharacterized repeat protein (TIGR04138 family)
MKSAVAPIVQMATPQVLEKIREELIENGRDVRFSLAAYEFVLNGLEFYLTSIGEKRHVSGQELSKGLLFFSHKQFGLLAQDVLDSWGVKATDDFGYIVYNMISLGIMSKQPEDSLEHFFGVISFSEFFKAQECFEIDKEYIKRIKGA